MKKLTDVQIKALNEVYGYPKEFNRRIDRERPIWDAQEQRMIDSVRVTAMWIIAFMVALPAIFIMWVAL
jgi:hypothetical protein